jgi:hypothetical protein
LSAAKKEAHPPFLFLNKADRQAFLAYRLTPDLFRRLEQFAETATKLYERDVEFRAELKRYAETEAPGTVAGNVALLERDYPRIRGLLSSRGLMPRDLPLGVFSVMIGVWLVTSNSPEELINSQSYFPKENVEFVGKHLQRAKNLLDRLPKALD